MELHQVDCYAHFPFLRLHADSEAALGAGRFLALDFAAWERLEGRARCDERTYRRVRPVFYHQRIPFSGPFDTNRIHEHVVEPFQDAMRKVYYALLLSYSFPLYDPRLSQSYLVPADPGRMRISLEGDFSCDTIVSPAADSAYIGVNRQDMGRIQANLAFLEDHRAACADPHLGLLFDTLARTARPEMRTTDATFHYLLLLEDLLLDPGGADPAEAFGRRCGVLAARDFPAVAAERERWTQVYRLRRDLCLGRSRDARMARIGLDDYQLGLQCRDLARSVARALIGFHDQGYGAVMGQALDAAAGGRDAYQTLAARLHRHETMAA